MARKMFISVIVDESGSMANCRGATISGFNEYVNDQRKKAADEGNTVLFTLTKFNTDCTVVHLATPISDIPELTRQGYMPGGMTALYDAIGHTLKSLEADLQRETEKPGVLVVIITDGEENSSKEYSQAAIMKLIEEKKKEGNFTFVFLGADIDVWQGQALGIDVGNMIKYGKGQSVAAFRAMSANTSKLADQVYGSPGGASLGSSNFIDNADGVWDAAVQADPADAVGDVATTDGAKTDDGGK